MADLPINSNDAQPTNIVDATTNTRVANVSQYGELSLNFPSNTSKHTDLFNKQRVSQPSSLFTAQFLYDKRPLEWDELLANGGTSTFNSSSSTISMAVTTTSGSRVVRQTKQYFAYEPGRAEQMIFTVQFGTATTNCTQNVGLFDDNNGIFVQLNGSTFSAVKRSSNSGSPIDTIITQSNFNLDKLDGTGPSGVTLDITKSQIFFIEYQWFGVGTVRYGLYYNGQIYYFHVIHNANLITSTYMQRGSLPARYEIVNTGTTANSVTLTQICCVVQSEAGYNPTGTNFSADTGSTGRSIAGSSSLPMISIRLNSSFIRATLQPISFSLMSAGAHNMYYQIILNGSLTGASFSSIANSAAQLDTSATSVSGGTVLDSGYVSSQIRQPTIDGIYALLPIVSNIAGTSDILTLNLFSLSGGADTFYASLEWEEFV